jgi:hypothetical protein
MALFLNPSSYEFIGEVILKINMFSLGRDPGIGWSRDPSYLGGFANLFGGEDGK